MAPIIIIIPVRERQGLAQKIINQNTLCLRALVVKKSERPIQEGRNFILTIQNSPVVPGYGRRKEKADFPGIEASLPILF